ncbi:GLIPR1L1 isoform 3, partial [Pan troglodytes]
LSPQSPKGQLAAWSNKMSFLFRAEEGLHNLLYLTKIHF